MKKKVLTFYIMTRPRIIETLVRLEVVLNKLLVKTVWRKWKTEIKQEIKLQKMEKASKGASDSVEESQSQLKGPQGHLRQRGSAAAGTASGTLEGFSCS